MSSTGKTPNLGLCQWEETDPFLREDMNGDFAKIDGAFGDLPRQKLFDVTVSNRIFYVQFDFTEIDLTPFGELEIFFMLSSGGKIMRMNGVTSSSAYYFTAPGVSASTDRISVSSGVSRLILAPDAFIHLFSGAFRIERMLREDFPQLNALDLYADGSSNYFAAGDRIIVWGVKI